MLLCVGASILVSVSLLGYFKYANFIIEQINSVSTVYGWGQIAWENIALPIGISFYTFQSMSYVFDVARGVCLPLRNPFDFAMYVALFPQLIAGPIVRFSQIEQEIAERETRLSDFTEGTLRFTWGLIKKVIFADGTAQLATAAFAANPESLSMLDAWVGILAYAVQIYFDFSAYSDMAIGLGRIFGFHFPENFCRPYSAISITDFWRRWHMTLSSWMRDYLYIPLGGSRCSKTRTYFNLWTVFLVTGLWHGASWTFVCWGIYHGALLVFEKSTKRNYVDDKTFRPMQQMLIFFLVVIGWVLFRADNINHALAYYAAMVSVDGIQFSILRTELSIENLAALGIGLITCLLPRNFSAAHYLSASNDRMALTVRITVYILLFPYAIMSILSGSFSPFLYFRF